MKLGTLEIDTVNAGFFRLDGGAMFGIVPKVAWQKLAPADDKNRIRLALNTMLIRTGRKTYLVDTGIGLKHDAAWGEMYSVQNPPSLMEGLKTRGLAASDIDGVILSHLHFDHAGGATERSVSGEFIPSFPKATYYIQKGMWQEALEGNPRTKGSYRPDDFLPLEKAGRVRFLDGDEEIEPGIRVVVTGGHVKHHQVVFAESGGRKAVYWADLLPTSAHLKPAWVMGYDLYPAAAAAMKQAWLAKAVKEEWVHVFEHDPDVAIAHVRADAKGVLVVDPIAAVAAR